MWPEEADPQVVKLEARLRALSDRLSDAIQTEHKLRTELQEARQEQKEVIYKLQTAESRAVTAEEQLRKRTEVSARLLFVGAGTRSES